MNVSPPFIPRDDAALARDREFRRPLRVLLVEDNEDDAALVLRLLRRGGYEPEWEQVQTAEALDRALSQQRWDIVLSDYNMPQFDALQALRALRERSAHVPFIIISGSIGEETAVAAMRAGANDYVMKTNLPRLVPAVERELRESGERLERARTQRALLDLQDKFQVIFHESLDVVVVLDPRGTILHVNRAIVRTMGYDERSLIGQPFASLWPRRQHAAVETILESIRQEGRAFYSGPLRRLDGTTFPMDLQASKVAWGDEQAIIVTLRDVSERQRAAQRLADEKEQLAVTLRSMGDGVITTDHAGRVILLNEAAERLTGWTQAEAAGQPLEAVLPLTRGEEPLDPGLLHTVLTTGDTVLLSPPVQLRDPKGRQYALAVKAAPIASHNGMHTGVVTLFRDITVEQKMEEEFQKASKLESVGLLAGGIAHDFNNILTAILGHLSLAKATATPSPQVLSSIEKACLYATGLTRQLLTFAKGNEPVRRQENLGELVEESVRFALHGSNMQCRFEISAELWPVDLDRGQINQVLNNLVINAVQAAPEGGRLYVEAYNLVISGEEEVATLTAGNYARVTIRDNGTGIPAEHLARIFDPYFTTKSSGSGLGLATSYSIIKKHGGLIRVESELGIGTEFSIYLPVKLPETTEEKRSEATTGEQPSAAKAEGKRVLFMDDEEILQELVAAMLSHLGYEVVCAARGEEALALYAEALASGKRFDAVLVDLTVPGGMGGYETVRQLRQVDPQVKAVVSSGYSNDPIMSDFHEHGFRGMIAKPYQMAELSEVLRRVIHETVE